MGLRGGVNDLGVNSEFQNPKRTLLEREKNVKESERKTQIPMNCCLSNFVEMLDKHACNLLRPKILYCFFSKEQ